MAEACTCTIRNHGRVIEFCPMHKAAEQMLAALEAIDKETASLQGLRSVVRVIVHGASAQSRGRGETDRWAQRDARPGRCVDSLETLCLRGMTIYGRFSSKAGMPGG